MAGRRVTTSALAWLATLGLSGASALLARTAQAQLELVRDGGAVADPAALLLAIAAAAAALVAARLGVCAAAAGVALLARSTGPSGAVATRLAVAASPRSMRPALAALLAGGVALTMVAPAGTASLATASAAVGGSQPGPVVSPARDLPAAGWQSLPRPGWLPSPPLRPAASADQAPGALVQLVSGGAARRGAADHELVVRRGDTLWALAARALGPSASAAEIAAEWPRWWQTNKRAIGDDPDLLVPGTRLTAPAAQSTPTEGSR